MANRIKGITVEIGGETTGLDKALQGVKLAWMPFYFKQPLRNSSIRTSVSHHCRGNTLFCFAL